MIHKPENKSAARIQLEIQLMRLAYQDRAARGTVLNRRNRLNRRARLAFTSAAVLILLLALFWRLA